MARCLRATTVKLVDDKLTTEYMIAIGSVAEARFLGKGRGAGAGTAGFFVMPALVDVGTSATLQPPQRWPSVESAHQNSFGFKPLPGADA